jgi:hypothetical protein
MTLMTSGSVWFLHHPRSWQIYPVGSIATVTWVNEGAVGYRYENGAKGVMPATDFTRCFSRA